MALQCSWSIVKRWNWSKPLSTLRRFSSESEHHDIVIVGGGVAGLTMAKVLQQKCPRFSVALLERGSSPKLDSKDGQEVHIPNPRSYALSPKSLNLLKDAVTQDYRKKFAFYNSMQIWESLSPAMLVFSQHDLEEGDHLGACVEDSVLVQTLSEYLDECGKGESGNLSLQTGVSLDHMDVQSEGVNLAISSMNDENKKVEKLSADLLIAADGAMSPIRSQLGIPFQGIEYGRTAVTFTVEVNEHFLKNTRAYQRFLPNGPIALLPTFSKTHFVIVWSTTPQEAKNLKSMDIQNLVEALNDTLQQGPERLKPLFEEANSSPSILNNLAYGIDRVLDTVHYGMGMRHWSDDPAKFVAPPQITNVVSPRFAFPLSCKVVPTFQYARKVALLGDAAHTVHPLAGQGLNLGLDDVEVLSEVLRKAHDAGMEAGQFLDEYQKNRQLKIPAMVGGIHAIHSLFDNKSVPLLHGKSIGMSLINQAGLLRKQLAKIATGL